MIYFCDEKHAELPSHTTENASSHRIQDFTE